MKIKDLVDQIISYSHNEDTPDTDLSAKTLTWLNSAYHELLQENLAFLKYKMLKQESIEMTDGFFELPADFYLFEKIKLKNGNVISKEDKSKYSIEGNLLFINNFKDEVLELVYIPQFQHLKLDDSLSIMHISSNYVQSLVWGALVWSSIYERGLHTNSELSLFEAKWSQAKQNYKVTLATYSDQVLRTTPYCMFN
tara:strand:+ start:695 stop:1282 length:588 start_codon:yes stop_codon:yes gene_type:complete